jgi:hypothetical protein
LLVKYNTSEDALTNFSLSEVKHRIAIASDHTIIPENSPHADLIWDKQRKCNENW